MALRTVGIRLMAEVSAYTAGLGRASAATRSFTQDLDAAARAGQLDAVADQAGRMGLALAGGFLLVEQAAARFEQQMSRVDAVTDTTAQGMRDLADAAIQAGKDTSFSAIEAARAEEELAKAGIAVSDILGGALKGSLALAAAGSLDLAEAADIAAKTMNIFKLRGSDVGHIADVLAAAANKSATDVHEMGEALRMGGLAANAAGMSLEETVGTLAAFADRALIGSDAGTSLKTMLLMLQAPTDKSAALMKQLGIDVYDLQGNFIGTTKLATELREALGHMTQEQRNAALAQIFGADAVRAANVLYEIGERGVRDYTDAVNDQGAAADTARQKTDNLIGDIERLTGELEALAIQSGSGANEGLRVLVQMAEMLAAGFGALPAPLSGTAVVLAAVAGAGLLAFSAFVRMRSGAANAVSELRAMGPAGERAAAGLDRAGKHASKAALGFAALMVAQAALSSFDEPAAEVDRLTKSLEELGKTGARTGELRRIAGGDLHAFARDLERDGYAVSSFARSFESTIPVFRQVEELLIGASFSRASENIRAMDQAIVGLVQQGKLDEARIAMTRLAQESGLSWDEFSKRLPAATQAIADAEKSASGMAQAEARAAKNAELMAEGMLSAEAAGKKILEIFESLNGAAHEWAEAEINVEDALDKLTDGFRENGRTLDVNTDKGRENKENLLAMAKAAVEAYQARYNETGSIAQASAAYEQYIARLRVALIQQGLTKQQAQELIDTYARMPSQVATTVQANGLGNVIGQMRTLLGLLGRLVPFGGALSIAGWALSRRWGGITEHAETGLLRDAAVYSPQGPARYAFAEPATGGEAFIPKHGDPSRSLGILNRAAGWYGHTLMPAGGMAGGGVGAITLTVRVDGRVQVQGTGVLSGLRDEIELRGGDVQKVLGRR